MQFDIISIFPNAFDSYINEGILGRSIESGKVVINKYDIRDNATNKHHKVDDNPYGGGVGMVMQIEPIYKTLQKIERKKRSRCILLSARGEKWTQKKAREYSESYDQIILICGRYEGIDERIVNFIDEEISIGDYVMTGGELGALVLTDTIIRLLPGVLGKDESSEEESHSSPGYIEYPHYIRPEVFEADGKKYEVPEVLLSGNHKEIESWRKENSRK